MNIWLLNHYAAPSTSSRGTRHATLGKYLAERGHDVTIFASATCHRSENDSTFANLAPRQSFAQCQMDQVRWRFVRTRTYQKSTQRFFNMRDFMRNACLADRNLPKPDVVVGSCVHPLAVEAAMRLAARHDAAFIYEIRDIWPESLLELGSISKWNPVYWLFDRINRRALRQAQGVIVLFPGMATYTARFHIPDDRVCYIPNGVDAEQFPSATDPPNREEFTVTYFGAHSAANRLDVLLDAAHLLDSHPDGRNIRFQVIGEGPQKALLMEYARSRELTNVQFEAPVAKQDLGKFIQDTDCFSFCLETMPVLKRYGISSNKLFDYMAGARPVLFACESFNNPVEEAKAGLSVTPTDPRALADGILQLRAMPWEARREMGRRGRAYVLDHHNHARLTARLEAFLERMRKTATSSSGLQHDWKRLSEHALLKQSAA